MLSLFTALLKVAEGSFRDRTVEDKVRSYKNKTLYKNKNPAEPPPTELRLFTSENGNRLSYLSA